MCGKNIAKNQVKRCQITEISVRLWKIDVAVNDCDNGLLSRNDGVSAHAQRKIAKMAIDSF